MIDIGVIAVFVSKLIQCFNQLLDTIGIFSVLAIVCGIQIHRLRFSMLFCEVIGKRRTDMAFNFQYVLQKQLTQILVKMIQSNNIFKPSTILILLRGRVFERCFISTDQTEISDLC